MKITDVRVKLSKKEDSALKAVVSITIDGCFVVHDLKVLQGDNGLYIVMPSRKFTDATGKTDHKDIAHALNNETRAEIKAIVLESYEKELQKA